MMLLAEPLSLPRTHCPTSSPKSTIMLFAPSKIDLPSLLRRTPTRQHSSCACPGQARSIQRDRYRCARVVPSRTSAPRSPARVCRDPQVSNHTLEHTPCSLIRFCHEPRHLFDHLMHIHEVDRHAARSHRRTPERRCPVVKLYEHLRGPLLHLWDLGSNVSEDLLFSSFKENPDCFVFHFATWSSFLTRTKFVKRKRKRTELATKFLL